MDKIQIGQNFFIPMPVVLVGNRFLIANFMAVAGARGQMQLPMLVCGIANHHYTPKGIAGQKPSQ